MSEAFTLVEGFVKQIKWKPWRAFSGLVLKTQTHYFGKNILLKLNEKQIMHCLFLPRFQLDWTKRTQKSVRKQTQLCAIFWYSNQHTRFLGGGFEARITRPKCLQTEFRRFWEKKPDRHDSPTHPLRLLLSLNQYSDERIWTRTNLGSWHQVERTCAWQKWPRRCKLEFSPLPCSSSRASLQSSRPPPPRPLSREPQSPAQRWARPRGRGGRGGGRCWSASSLSPTAKPPSSSCSSSSSSSQTHVLKSMGHFLPRVPVTLLRCHAIVTDHHN